MIRKHLNIYWIVLLLLSSTVVFGSLESAKSSLEKGNQLYQENNFNGALEAYLSITEYESLELHYNLGNTYFKLNNIPKAILHFEKAAKISPSNEDLQMNLAICNSKIVDKIDALPNLGVEDLWSRIISASNSSTWNLCFLILFGGGFLFLCVGLILKPRRKLFSIIGIVVVIFSFLFFFLAYQSHERILRSQSAIIMSLKVDVKGSPSAEGIDVFVIHEGTKVQVLKKLDDWSEIKIANGNVGWIRNADFETI